MLFFIKNDSCNSDIPQLKQLRTTKEERTRSGKPKSKYSVISQFFFFFFFFFLQNGIKVYIYSWSWGRADSKYQILLGYDHSGSFPPKNCVRGQLWAAILDWSYNRKWLKFNPPSYFFMDYMMKKKIFIFDQNWGRDSAGSLFTKWRLWRHPDEFFKNRKKWHWQIAARPQIPSCVKIRQPFRR